MAQMSSKNFCHIVWTLPCEPCRSALLPAPWHSITATVSHWHQNQDSQMTPRHVQCAARCITAVVFHIKGHDPTLIVTQVGGVLTSSRTNVHVFMDASFWGPPAWDLAHLCLLPVHLLHLLNYVTSPREISGTCRFSDPSVLYPAAAGQRSRGTVLIPLDSRSIVEKKKPKKTSWIQTYISAY